MRRIGIIGVGEIAAAIVDGLCDDVEDPPEIVLSPRGARTAGELSQRYPTVRVGADNQDVVDHSDVVVIAVRPEHVAALTGLRLGPDLVVVNVMAGVDNDGLRATLDTDAPMVQAMPQRAVRERASVTITCPPHPLVDALFERLGGALPVADEAAFDVFTTVTAAVSTHFAYLAALAAWAVRHDIPAGDAERFVRGLFRGAATALGDDTRSLRQLVTDHETPQGINERFRASWLDAANTEALEKTLDIVLSNLD